MYFGVVILRVPQGLDYSQIIEDEDSPITMNGNEGAITQTTDDKPGQSSANQLTQGTQLSLLLLLTPVQEINSHIYFIVRYPTFLYLWCYFWLFSLTCIFIS